MNRYLLNFLLAVIACAPCSPELDAADVSRPNIVVILTDDQGYADISLNPRHSQEVSTPHMDALAKSGVVFSQGYTSGHVCSPTRAGLMIGGYSQRVGVYTAGDGGRGFDPKKKIFPAFLPDDYFSTAIGKWHLGLDDDYPELKWHAMNRGFDECYKFMGRGAHSYFDLRSDSTAKFGHPIYRNKQRIDDEGYLTNRLTQEAVAFIDRNKKRPFFLYLAYNAVHAPAEAPAEDIEAFRKKYPGLSNQRAILMAMLKHLDDGVGDVVGKLKQERLFDNTLLFFLTDNGGAKVMSADNTPLRGFKGSLDEGGIRTPFIVSWPSQFTGGRTVDTPVISFDILPTVLDATKSLPADNDFDGKSLLPLLTGRATAHHDTLFWSKGKEDEWAVRRGDWKLHHKRGTVELIDLAEDPWETTNLADRHPERVNELRIAFDKWIAPMVDPITGGEKRVDGQTSSSDKPPTEREKRRARVRAERKKKKDAKQSPEKGNSSTATRKKPHVVFILVDDMGFGDPGCFNPESKIPTPHIDSLARDGMRFTDAHAPGPLCHMSRYGLMTGRYPFRADVSVWRKQPLIKPGQMTVASLAKAQGYHTAMVGKWHLGFQEDGYDEPLPGGPIDCGFHSFFGIRASTDIPPYFYIRGDRAVQPPSGRVVANSSEGWSPIQGAFWRAGGIAPDLTLEEVLPRFTDEAIQVIDQHADNETDARPLMLYLAYPAPHTPWLPSREFGGKSGAGMYGDFVMMVDAQIGRVLTTLRSAGMEENTLLVVTSDNGPVWYDADVERLGHDSAGGLRGMKSDVWEAGHRMPFIVRWPERVNPGSQSKQLVCFTDLLATFADLLDVTLPASAGPDSLSFLPALTGQSPKATPVRTQFVMRAGSVASMMTIRSGDWKLITGLGSGGFSKPSRLKPGPNEPKGQLYNLAEDIGETTNLFAKHPEIVSRLTAEMKAIVTADRRPDIAKRDAANDPALQQTETGADVTGP